MAGKVGPNSFRGDIAVRLTWPGHGVTTQIISLKLITHPDGTVVGLTRNEWAKMLPPLLIQRDGQWYFAGQPVEFRKVGGSHARELGG